eukprot:COSAG01_NODE_42942_length_434_cov_98.764179_1_plen_63_part_10
MEAFRPDILLDRSEDPLGHVKGRRPRSRDLGRRPRWCASPSARHPLRKSQSVSKSQQVVPIVA